MNDKIKAAIGDLSDLAENRNVDKTVVNLPIQQIDTQEQDRVFFDDTEIALLARSIEKHGVLEPIKVRLVHGNRYRIVAGERRYRASVLADNDTIPALIAHGDEDTDENEQWTMLIENVARKDLTMYEKAAAFQRRKDAGHSNKEICDSVGMAESSLRKYLSILNYPVEVLNLAELGLINSYKHFSAAKQIFDNKPSDLDELKTLLQDGQPLDRSLQQVGFVYEELTEDKSNTEKRNVSRTGDKNGVEKQPPITLTPHAACLLVQRAKREPQGKYNPAREKDMQVVRSYIASLQSLSTEPKE